MSRTTDDANGWAIDDHVGDAARECLRAGLTQFNDAHVRHLAAARRLELDPLDLELVVRDDAGTIRGGALGYTHWGWLHVRTLWVAERDRGHGLGRRLMVTAERLARERGCHHSRLATYDFQARAFYQRLGYSVWGELSDYPPGHTSYAMVKDLDGHYRSA